MEFKVDSISFSYRDKLVLDNISFSFKDGEVVALLGRNGSGKTTLMRVMLGLLKPSAGNITLDSTSLFELSYKERAKRIAYIPQFSSTSFPTTVLESVVMGRNPSLSTFSRPKPSDYAIAHQYIKKLGIEHLENKSTARISGGERQLVLIARALSQDARILFLDEPTASLDYSNSLLILDTLASLKRDGYSIVITTHSPEQALELGTNVLILDNTHSELYTPSMLKDGKRLSKLYGRELFITDLDTGSNRRLICTLK